MFVNQNQRHTERNGRKALYMKTALHAVFLAIPSSWVAISICDNASVSDAVRYLLSPGSILGAHLAIGPTSSWRELGDELTHYIAIALLTDIAFYSILIFGIATIVRGLGTNS
jgi:hypothetical protein